MWRMPGNWTSWPLRGDGETREWVRVRRDERKKGFPAREHVYCLVHATTGNIPRPSMISMGDIVFRGLGTRIYACIHPIPVQYDRITLFALTDYALPTHTLPRCSSSTGCSRRRAPIWLVNSSKVVNPPTFSRFPRSCGWWSIIDLPFARHTYAARRSPQSSPPLSLLGSSCLSMTLASRSPETPVPTLVPESEVQPLPLYLPGSIRRL